MIVGDLTGFILARVDEDEQDAGLFHEFGCPAGEQEARDGLPGTWCACPVPARIRAIRDIVAVCERPLRLPRSGESGMASAAGMIKVLGAVALDYERNPWWREQWRP